MKQTAFKRDKASLQKGEPIYISSLSKTMFFHSQDGNIAWVKSHPLDDVAIPLTVHQIDTT